MVLPCRHQKQVVDQVQPTINLLTKLDVLHPDILVQHAIQPADYNGSLVFRSAVESIRGRFIASSTVGRQALVRDVLQRLLERGWIADYAQSSGRARYDFTIALERNPDTFAALEVKGGEGNSINISERPIWAKEFAVWCHLDGAIVNQPAHGAHSIVNRITNEMVLRQKQVDILFFKDILCGTRARPCPKYPGREDQMGYLTAPDVFLFPQRIPTIEDPEPPMHSLETLRLPGLILNLFDVRPNEVSRHLWEVHVKITSLTDGWQRREVQVWYQDQVISQSKSRLWRPE